MKTKKSQRLYEKATKVMVGGVSSPVRAFRAVGGTPVFMERGKGSHVWDVDGNSYVDYVCSWGPLILGHSNPGVMRAVTETSKKGTSFGAPTLPELGLAEKVCKTMPNVEKVRFVNSGTEANMSALRLARAFTGRSKVLKFEGCYHGHADPFLSHAGSGMATFGVPDSAGVPQETVADTLTIEFNDEGQLEEVFRSHGNELAAVIIEPVAGNMGVVPPSPGYLQRLRRLSGEEGSLLVFDEVITGFRVHPSGAQALYHVKPDLTCLGKVVGGGFPVGAYGGRADVMRMVSPEGPVYQAGTLSGNPVAMAAGLATLSQLNSHAYAKLEKVSSQLEDGLVAAAASCGLGVTVNRVGSMLGLFFGSGRVRNFRDAKATNHALYPSFHRAMLETGSYFPPSAFETIFLSTAHTRFDVQRTADAAARAFRGLAK